MWYTGLDYLLKQHPIWQPAQFTNTFCHQLVVFLFLLLEFSPTLPCRTLLRLRFSCTACWRSSHSFSVIEEIHTLQFAFLEEGHGCTFWIFVFFAEIYWNPFFHLHSQCFLCYATPNHNRSTLVLNNACDLFPKCLWHIIMLFCVLQTFTFAARSQVRFLMTLPCRSCLSKLFHAFLPRIWAALSKRCRLLTDLTLTSF